MNKSILIVSIVLLLVALSFGQTTTTTTSEGATTTTTTSEGATTTTTTSEGATTTTTTSEGATTTTTTGDDNSTSTSGDTTTTTTSGDDNSTTTTTTSGDDNSTTTTTSTATTTSTTTEEPTTTTTSTTTEEPTTTTTTTTTEVPTTTTTSTTTTTTEEPTTTTTSTTTEEPTTTTSSTTTSTTTTTTELPTTTTTTSGADTTTTTTSGAVAATATTTTEEPTTTTSTSTSTSTTTSTSTSTTTSTSTSTTTTSTSTSSGGSGLTTGLAGVTTGSSNIATSYYINDNAALNFALTFELLEASFYNNMFLIFNQQDFINAGYNASVYTYMRLINDHENMHVAALQAALQARNATAVGLCLYNFNAYNTSVNNFIAGAKMFENAGVQAYTGVITAFTDASLLQFAATIATVEARHASYLNKLTGGIPFPDSLDFPTTPVQALAFANTVTFAGTCAGNVPVLIPQSRDLFSGIPGGSTNIAPTNPEYLNDNKVLQFALTLENLEASFYTQGLAAIPQSTFTAYGFNQSAYDYLTLIRDHENSHVALLAMVLTQRQATPVAACTYNFNFTSVAAFLNQAKLLENTGVSAYTGAANTITNVNLLTTAATIATVEGRHAAWLNELTGESPSPAAYDVAIAPAAIFQAAAPFFNACNYNLTDYVPQPASNVKFTTQPITSQPLTSRVLTSGDLTTSPVDLTTAATPASDADRATIQLLFVTILSIILAMY